MPSCKGHAFPWLYESPRGASQQPFAHLGAAFQRFFKRQGKYPRLQEEVNAHAFYETELGIPVVLAYLENPMLESLPVEDAMADKLLESDRGCGKKRL